MEGVEQMICKNPYMKDGMAYGCGQCLPCRVNKRRLWTNRIVLESMCHEHNAFVTLTYDNEHLPENGSLVPQHLKDWQKRLRYHTGLPLRFFSVGEYGDETKRPHYHAAVFGFKGCEFYDPKATDIWTTTLQASWKMGHVFNGSLTQDSAQYIAGYVTKKMTDRKPEEKYHNLLRKGKTKLAADYKKKVIDELDGKHPEFARMSNRPGIGALAIPDLTHMLETEHGCNLIEELNDVPDIFKIGNKQILLGSYLKGKLRERIGINEATKEKKLQVLRKEKIEEYLSYRSKKAAGEKVLGQKEFEIDKNLQKIRDLEKRYNNKKSKGGL
jgi:hypothetical protein